MMASRKDWLGKDEGGRERMTPQPGMPGYYRYARYNGRDPFKYDRDQEQGLFDDLQNASPERGYSNRRHGGRKHTRDKVKVRHESATYPGWRLPHPWLVKKFRNESESDIRRTRSLPHDRSSGRHERNHGPLYSDRYEPHEQFGEQYQNPPPDFHGHAMPTHVYPERSAHQRSQTDMPPTRPPINHPPPNQRDYAQGGDQQPYMNAGYGNVAPAPGNYVPPAASTIYSGSHSIRPASKEPSHVLSSRSSSRRSKPSTAGGGVRSDENREDAESYVTQSVHSLGSHASAATLHTWRKPPSTIYTLPQFKPTNRNDSVAPWDSLSQQGVRLEERPRPSEALHSANERSRNSKARSRGSHRSATINEVSTQGSRTARTSKNSVMFREPISRNPPPRSSTISTINTVELPDTSRASSAFSSKADRAKTRWPGPTRSKPPPPVEDDPAELSSNDESTCPSASETESEAQDLPSGFPQGATQPQNTYRHPPYMQQQQMPYGQPMQGYPPGTQQNFQQQQQYQPMGPNPGFAQSQQQDQGRGCSRQSSARGTPYQG